MYVLLYKYVYVLLVLNIISYLHTNEGTSQGIFEAGTSAYEGRRYLPTLVPSKVPFLSFERNTKVICMPGNRASSVPSFVSHIRYAGHILYWTPAFFGACSNQLPASLTYFTRQASMHSNRRPEFKIARRDYGRDSALGQVRQLP